MTQFTAELTFGPHSIDLKDDPDGMVRLDFGQVEGSWPEYVKSTTGDGGKAYGVLLLDQCTDLNLYMFEVDMEDWFKGEWEHVSQEPTVKISADDQKIVQFPEYTHRFKLVNGDPAAFQSALEEHLGMVEISIGGPHPNEAPGVDWGKVDPVILMNPRVKVTQG